MELSNSIIKNLKNSKKSQKLITQNIYDVFRAENNIVKEFDEKDVLIREIRTKRFKVKREEILKFKKINDIILNNAKSQADKIIRDAYQEAQAQIIREKYAIKSSAYKEGYDEGYKKSIQIVENEKKDILKNALTFYENAEKQVEKYLKEKEKEIRDLIFLMVDKIIKKNLENEDFLNDLIYESIRNIKDRRPVIIKCNEINYKSIFDYVEGLKNSSGILGDFHVVINDSVTNGEFLIERNGGVIKYSVDKSLDKIKQLIFEEKLDEHRF